jgi:hypothetical protein
MFSRCSHGLDHLANGGDHTASDLGKRCALGGTRTPNLLIRSQMLCPLSYERRSPTSLARPHPGHSGAGGDQAGGPSQAQPSGQPTMAEAPGFEPGMGITQTALAVRRHRPD